LSKKLRLRCLFPFTQFKIKSKMRELRHVDDVP